jgi:ABC-2 type transport system permease protein
MKSRTSFFNPTVLLKDITRFAPVWGLYLIGGLLIGLDTLSYHSAIDISFGHGAEALASTISSLSTVNLLYAIVTAQVLFGDLFNSRLCNALHALPLRREGWFLTHITAGLLFSFIPNLILCLSFLPYMGELWYVSFIWLLGMAMEYLFFFGVAVFSAMCAGNRVATAAVYALVNFGSMIAYWFVGTFYAPLLYGIVIRMDSFARLCPVAYLADSSDLVLFDRSSHGSYHSFSYVYQGLSEDWVYLAVAAAIGLALLGLGLLLYRRRKMESAGNFVAFSWLKPVFSVVFTLSVGALLEIIGQSFMGAEYVFLAIGIVVGYFVGQMLLQRTVRVFRLKAFGTCAAIGIALVLSIVLTGIDPLGITRWTPEPAKVEQVIIEDNYSIVVDEHGTVFTTPTLIKKIVAIHEQLVKEGDPTGSSDPYRRRYFRIEYHMSDGRQIKREYYYNAYGEAGTMLKKFYQSPELTLGYADWEEYLPRVDQVYVFGKTFFNDEARELVSAIRTDCEAGLTVATFDDAPPYTTVFVTTDDGEMHSVKIYSYSKNTVDWLKEQSTQP